MKHFTFDYEPSLDFFDEESFDNYIKMAVKAEKALSEGKGSGSDYTGWLRLPEDYDREEFERLKNVASGIREIADAVIVIGIGGSYLGARSALDALGKNSARRDGVDEKKYPEILYAGNNISQTYLNNLISLVEEKDIVLNVVSKSGTTLEPAIAFRILRDLMEKKYGSEKIKERIICTTDKGKGLLREIADREGYETFIIPDDIGGRYSVLTPVGLLPMAAGGIDIDKIMEGAASAMKRCMTTVEPLNNPATLYAALRNLFYGMGKTIEVMACYEPSFEYITKWWQQLFGESEGKEGKGIYPSNLIFSTDLHSMGQYLQEGRRDIFLTTLWEDKPQSTVKVPESTYEDGLEYLQGKEMHFVNEQACKGTIGAHSKGGVPNLLISVPSMTPYYYGEIVYFFQKACAISGYILGVNPFDQPGVEEYKKNMYLLLGK